MSGFNIDNVLQINTISAALISSSDNCEYFTELYNYYKLIYVNSGSINVICGDNIFKCNAGDLILHKPNEIHNIKFSDKNYAEYTVIAFSAEGDFLESTEGTVFKPEILYKQLINNICDKIKEFSNYEEILPRLLNDDKIALSKFALELELLLLSSTVAVPQLIVGGDADLFSKAVKILNEKVYGQISVGDLAIALNISLSHLKRIFAAYSLVGVHEYFMLLKINKAKEILSEGKSVTETAELLSFNNQNYFSAAFKRITGISPKDLNTNKKVIKASKPIIKQQKKAASDMPSYLL